jgi:hypothetical protein
MSEQTEITITRNSQGAGVFPAVEVTQSQLVYWKNADPQSAHWPVFPDQPGVGPRFQTGPADTSDPVQPYGSTTQLAPGVSKAVNYGCQIAGHQAEAGVITVWADFLSATILNDGIYNQLPDGTVGTAYPAVALTVGGKPGYCHTLSDASLPAGITVTDGAAGVQIGGTPIAAGQDFAFTVHCTDALGNRVDQTFTLRIAASATTAT